MFLRQILLVNSYSFSRTHPSLNHQKYFHVYTIKICLSNMKILKISSSNACSRGGDMHLNPVSTVFYLRNKENYTCILKLISIVP